MTIYENVLGPPLRPSPLSSPVDGFKTASSARAISPSMLVLVDSPATATPK